MKRSIGSVISTVTLLSVAAGAAAVNVRILESNRSDTSVLTVQSVAEAMPSAEAVTVAATEQEPVTSVQTPMPAPTNAPQPVGKRVLGTVAGDDDDDDDEHEDDDDHKFRGDRHGKHGKFMPLTPQQAGLLRVAALAQVAPEQARDAANGVGSADVIARVRDAAAQIGVPLAEIGAVTDVPPERGRRHGGDDDHEDEGDDDD